MPRYRVINSRACRDFDPRLLMKPIAPNGYYDDDWCDLGPLLPSLEVDDHEPVFTGLLDASGEAILRMPEPMGFHNPRDLDEID